MPALAVEVVTPGVGAPSRPPRAANSHSASVGSSLARPLCVGLGIAIGDVDGRMVLQTLGRALRTHRMADIRTLLEVPPGTSGEIYAMARFNEYHRAGIEHLGQGPG